jgi:hypothetical protein
MVRRTRLKVFPEPGPAMTSRGPSQCATILRCASFMAGYSFEMTLAISIASPSTCNDGRGCASHTQSEF